MDIQEQIDERKRRLYAEAVKAIYRLHLTGGVEAVRDAVAEATNGVMRATKARW